MFEGIPTVYLAAPDSAAKIVVADVDTLPVSGDSLRGIYLYSVSDALFVNDGTLAIANKGVNEILLIGRDGSVKQRIGREGEGPGEYRWLDALLPISDSSFAAYDRLTMRLSLYSRSSDKSSFQLMREWYPPRPGGGSRTLAVGLIDAPSDFGDMLFVGWNQLSSTISNPKQGANEIAGLLYVADLDRDTVVALLGEFVHSTIWLGRYPRSSSGLAVYGAAPFASWSTYGVAASHVIVVSSDTIGFSKYAVDGHLAERFARNTEVRSISATDRQRFIRQWLADKDPQLQHLWLNTVASFEFPNKMPALRTGWIGSDGSVWVEPWSSWDDPQRTIVGYTSSGELVGALHLDNRETVLDITSDGIVTVKASPANPERLIVRYW